MIAQVYRFLFMPFIRLRKYGFASRILILPSLILAVWTIFLILIVTSLLDIDVTVELTFKIFIGLQAFFYLLFIGSYPSSSKYEMMKNEMKYNLELEKKSFRTLLIVSLLLSITYYILTIF